MKVSIGQVDVSPKEPVYLAGYVQRKTRMEGLHDPIMCTVLVIETEGRKITWCQMDIGGTSKAMIDEIIRKAAEKGTVLDRDEFVISATHTHSGPVTGRRIGMDSFGEPEERYFDYLCDKAATLIHQIHEKEGTEVTARYSDVLIDGLYSNRNDKNKLSDKHEYMIGFFGKDGNPVGIYHLMSHHCTVVGSHSMLCSADLFGSLRAKLQNYFNCPFYMAQGNAGDMGNRQYRDGNDFEALERLSSNIFAQIINKYEWKDINLEGYEIKHVCYHAHFHVDYSEYAQKYIDYSERLKTATNVDDIKHLTGWVAMAKRKMDLPPEDKDIDMPADIIKLGQAQIVLVPGELGSILGLRIKKASKAQLCFVWGYNQSCDLGYMIEKEAFSTESQESQVTNYNPGVCDEFIEEIIRNM
ncbi:MAG: hypothetical protein II712_04910 [Erysipelotrichaceae bacterium]|nr:hypothetical protein [Erysipelotrichaceae bacterium]